MKYSIVQTPPKAMEAEEWTTEGGSYARERVTSPIQSVVVRRESPKGPEFREAAGYTFVLYSAKFPSVARMGDGRLALNASYEAGDGSRRWALLYSSDDGRSWGNARVSPVGRSTLVSVGGAKLMAVGLQQELFFSSDAGGTWKGPEPAPRLPDGRHCSTDVAHVPLVEGSMATFFAFALVEEGYTHWREGRIWAEAFVRRYDLDNHKWSDALFLPEKWGLSEGSLTRASNGDLVAACRAQMIDTPVCSDHWDGLATVRSGDDGRTWSEPDRHFLYGHHHVNLLNLPGGRILMTYAARVGELDGKPYHGVEAVISDDNGASWDWQRRYRVFRWQNSQIMHSPRSTLLSDGGILTMVQHDAVYSCAHEGLPGSSQKLNLGNVSAVIWRPWE